MKLAPVHGSYGGHMAFGKSQLVPGPSSLSCHELFSMLLLSNHLPILETTFLFLTSILRLRHKEPSTPEGPHEILEVHHQRVQWKCVKRIAVKSVDANVVKQFVIENYSR